MRQECVRNLMCSFNRIGPNSVEYFQAQRQVKCIIITRAFSAQYGVGYIHAHRGCGPLHAVTTHTIRRNGLVGKIFYEFHFPDEMPKLSLQLDKTVSFVVFQKGQCR